MAYPPTIPANDRVNATVTADNHPLDHNTAADALTDIVNELGAAPKGSDASIQARLDRMDAAIAANTTGISEVLPIGYTVMWPDALEPTLPGTWLAGGSGPVSRATYADLFALIGETYGPGDGTTTFDLPDTNDAVILGAGAKVVGTQGGTNEAQLPQHTHSASSGNQSTSHNHTVNPPSTGTSSDSHTHDYFIPGLNNAVSAGSTDSAAGNRSFGASGSDSHSHTVDIAQFNSGNQSASHSHTVTVTNTGVADLTDTNLPKYTVFSIWIKALN